jgi:HSP20 family protein
MNLIRYQPWGLMNGLHHDLDRLLERQCDDARATICDWSPTTDIREEDDRFVLRADVPGVDPKDIEITMEKGVLTVRGVRSAEKEIEKQSYLRVERTTGSFCRRFNLPDTADSDNITAKSTLGVLEVVIPKHAEIQPRRIDIQVD